MKGIEFLGASLKMVREFPALAKREAGHQLDRVQRGLDPTDWKPMTSVGQGVREIRIQHEGQYRVIYVATFKEKVYVLHAFQKKTQKTSRQDLDAAKRALNEVLREATVMSEKTQFESVWDALEDDPVRRENLKLRSELMITISETIKERGLKQQDAAELLHISQPRVSALLKGKIEEFRLDTLVDLAHRLGLHVSINVAA